MVFVFGLDIPLIEMFVVLCLLVAVCVALLVVMLRTQRTINKKLDLLLGEEHEIKEELDLTKMEEDKQLILMKQLVNELGKLHLISGQKRGQMTQLLDISRQAQSISPGQTHEQSVLLQQLLAHISNVDRTVQKESKQLDYIQQMMEQRK